LADGPRLAADATWEANTVNADQYARLNSVFVRACELTGDERLAFLDSACADDSGLRRGVEELLANDEGSLLLLADQSPPPDLSGMRWSDEAPPNIPGYEIQARIAAGGMGVVWRAVQQSTRREVAVKTVTLGGMNSRSVQARLQREIELSAALSHANIARVFDSGVGPGFAYYAMELVDGKELDRHVTEAQLSIGAIVALMIKVCGAVEYAHRRGVIHRDLKPSNVLVTADGRPVLVDFGLAKVLRPESNEATLSMAGLIVGTPAYMSPEQASGQSDLVDTRSDIYSLGAILYRLLLGTTPHDTAGTTLAVVRRISEEEPRPPRQVLPTIHRDLEAILLKLLARNPDERYGSAGAVADDLQRFLIGDAVSVRTPSLAYVLRKWTRRHRVAVTAGAIVCATLLASTVGFVVVAKQHEAESKQLAEDANEGRKQAVTSQQKAELVAYIHQLEVSNSEIANYRFPRALALLDECPPAYRDWEWRLLKNRAAARDGSYARIGPFDNSVRCITFSPDGKQVAIATGRSTTHAKGTPVIAVCDSQTGKVLTELRGHTDGIFGVSFTPDGKQILSGGRDQSLRRWDARTGKLLETFSPTPAGQMLSCVQFSADGRRVAFALYPKGLYLAEVPESLSWASILAAAQHVHNIAGEDDWIAFSPDGARLAWSTRVWQGDVGHLFVVDVQSRNVIGHQERTGGNPASSIDFNPNGRRLITADRRASVSLYSDDLSEVLGTYTLNEGSVRRAFYTAEGNSIVGMVPGGMARVWNERTREIERVLYPVHDLHTMDMAISRDRQRIAVATGIPTVVRLWDMTDLSAEDTTLSVHTPKARDVAVSPDGRFVATCGDDGNVQLYRWPERSLSRSIPGNLPHSTAVAFSPDARLLAIGWSINPNVKREAPFGQITIVDVQTGAQVRPPLDAPGWIWGLRFDETGRKLVIADGVTEVQTPQQSGSAHVVDWKSGEVLRSVRVQDIRCRCAVLTPSGDTLIAASEQTLSSWDVASGAFLAEDRIPDGRNFVHLIENGTRLVTGNGTTIEVRDLKSFEVLYTFHQRRDVTPGTRAMVGDVALHPSGDRLVSGSWNGTLTVWDIETRQALLTIPAHPTGVHNLVFSPDGNTLFSAGHDGKVRYWVAD
jgi:WD40 repeat protein